MYLLPKVYHHKVIIFHGKSFLFLLGWMLRKVRLPYWISSFHFRNFVIRSVGYEPLMLGQSYLVCSSISITRPNMYLICACAPAATVYWRWNFKFRVKTSDLACLIWTTSARSMIFGMQLHWQHFTSILYPFYAEAPTVNWHRGYHLVLVLTKSEETFWWYQMVGLMLYTVHNI